jgi:hypothetical protein
MQWAFHGISSANPLADFNATTNAIVQHCEYDGGRDA